jgi:hypothetical protein
MIKELIDLKGKVNLFTRPRRFGKTLNMSMVQYFFEDRGNEELNNYNKKLFNGLNIMKEGIEYTSHMGKYPVINISLKSAKQNSYKSAYEAIKEVIIREFTRHEYLLKSEKLNKRQKNIIKKICIEDKSTEENIKNSLNYLSEYLSRHYEKNVIILVDEYDVPLQSAYQDSFYDEMITLIRSLFDALKTNNSLEFAIITGCLRVSKEAIFTGINNLEIISIISDAYTEHYGFTNREIDEILKFYEFEEKKELIKDWYNGYIFGETEVYNPWSIINYIKSIYLNKNAFPKPYWANTSSNDIVRKLVEEGSDDIKNSIEGLINGNSMEIQVHEEITYKDIESNRENIWNFLFFTGYLKKVSGKMEEENIKIKVKVPNKEVLYIYKNIIRNWFNETIK